MLLSIYGELSVLYHNHFSISALYKQMRGSFDKVPWRRMICNNHASPKCLFIVWLELLGRLSTCENLLKIGIQCDLQCCLCESGVDSLQHLFPTLLLFGSSCCGGCGSGGIPVLGTVKFIWWFNIFTPAL